MHRQLYQRFKILRRNWVVSKIHWRDGEISHHVGVTFRASWWFFSLSPESLTRGSQPISCVGWRRISKINFESSFSNNVVDWLNPFPLISIKHTHTTPALDLKFWVLLLLRVCKSRGCDYILCSKPVSLLDFLSQLPSYDSIYEQYNHRRGCCQILSPELLMTSANKDLWSRNQNSIATLFFPQWFCKSPPVWCWVVLLVPTSCNLTHNFLELVTD